MVELATHELGADGFCTALGHIRSIQHLRQPDDITNKLLTTIYQATAHNNPDSQEAAFTVAKALNSKHLEVNIDAIVQAYCSMIQQGLGRCLSWQQDDVALQNIQARARAPSAWLLANVEGKILISTSNRSEASVGYATMDGDSAGGICPLMGVSKAFLQRWLLFAERKGFAWLGPIRELRVVNAQEASAQLRPMACNQRDEEDLMPYKYMERLEYYFIQERCFPAEALVRMRQAFPELAVGRLKTWVDRFYRLWATNQWKRERYAPGFHMDACSIDPKTSFRFPILSGGFAKDKK